MADGERVARERVAAPHRRREAFGKPMVIVTNAAGNQNVRALLRALDHAGMLSRFFTTIAWRRDAPYAALLPRAFREQLDRRVYEAPDAGRIACFPAREAVRHIAWRLGLSALTQGESGWASPYRIGKALDERVAAQIACGWVDGTAIYAYEDCALRMLGAAAGCGMRRFYELPTGYWRAARRLTAEERELQPEWAATLGRLRDTPAKGARKDAEVESADHIIVPSNFVRDTLREHPALTATIDVIPYGAPPVGMRATAERPPSSQLRLLYVGNLNQQKGIAYLFEAMRRLGSAATLTLVGQKPEVECPVLDASLKRHDWRGTMAHDRVLEVMAQHDALVFPSLFDGYGLVILEAMAQGLPVITTPNTGGPMAIEEGREGFIVPIRDADAIADRVLRLAGDRERLAAMSAAALEKANLLSWSRYEEALVRVMRQRMAHGLQAAAPAPSG